MNQEGKFYTIRQTANIIGIKVRTVREWLNMGKLEGTKDKVSGRWRIPEESVLKYVEKKKC